MDKIFHSTFDFFSHAIPGMFIVAGFYLLDDEINTFNSFLEIATKINVGSAFLCLVVGYAIGFAIYPIGRFLYKRLGFRIWKKEIESNVDLFISNKYVLIREFSPNNFKYVETWNMFCAMSHNLAVATFIVFLLALFKVIFLSPQNYTFWAVFLGSLVFLFFLFLHRAVIFSIWAANDLNATIHQLKLQRRSNK